MIEKRCELKEGHYVCDIDISKQEWISLLGKAHVFDEKSIEALKKWYIEPNHSATCFDIGAKYGLHSMSANGVVNGLGGRVQKELGRFIVRGVGNIAKGTRFITVMNSRETATRPKRFVWTIRPELIEAIEALDFFGPDEVYTDEELVSGVEGEHIPVATQFDYYACPKERREAKLQNGRTLWPRSKRVATNALVKAGYRCECGDHPLFKRRTSDLNYTEPHHLIPMSSQPQFTHSLDIEENIVSLCCNCHKQIHLGAGHESMLEHLFNQRKALLAQCGLTLSFQQLLALY